MSYWQTLQRSEKTDRGLPTPNSKLPIPPLPNFEFQTSKPPTSKLQTFSAAFFIYERETILPLLKYASRPTLSSQIQTPNAEKLSIPRLPTSKFESQLPITHHTQLSPLNSKLSGSLFQIDRRWAIRPLKYSSLPTPRAPNSNHASQAKKASFALSRRYGVTRRTMLFRTIRVALTSRTVIPHLLYSKSGDH